MITVRLSGGLGNQMFQFAAARRLALRHRTKLRLSIHWFNTDKARRRRYCLDAFHLADDESVETTETPWEELTIGTEQPVYLDRGYRFRQVVLDLPDGANLDGYFQGEGYFSDVEGQIRADFQLRDPLGSASIDREVEALKRPGRNLVSLHVRRGDLLLLRPDQALVIDIVRIRAAMAKFPGAEFVVFSDDRPWCTEHLSGDNVHPSPFERDFDDMIAMSRCDHHIIANSTFSWWGAWLNPNPLKVVMAPRKWHAGQFPRIPIWVATGQHEHDDISVSSWIGY